MLRGATRTLLQRGVLPMSAAYLAAGWGLLQFASWATDWWQLSSSLVTGTLTVWLLLLPAVIFFAWRRGAPEAEAPAAVAAPAAAPAAAARSLAVLPFVNLGSSAEDAYLSDGISDEILAALTRVEGLRVASRTSSFAYRGRDQDVRTIGRQLSVESVLEGTVQRSGGRLRVTTRLVNVADGYHLWSARYDKEMADVFAIEDEIAEKVARVLRVLLRGHGASGLPRVPRTDVRAYEYYLRGRQFFAASRLKSLRFAREMFEHALEIDPDYALAHTAVVETIAMECMYYPACGADIRDAERASARALELDPELPEAHSARAAMLFVQTRFTEAEQEFQAALRLEPRSFDALYVYARMCFQLGRTEDAARLFEDACAVQEDYQAAFFAAQSHESLGQTDAAVRMYERALGVAEAHMQLNPDDARAATMRAVALCRTGRRAEGLEWAERAVAIDPEDAGVRYNAACLYALAGDADRALAWLEDAVRAGFANVEWIARDPDLASLRGDPRVQALLDAHGGSAPGPDAPIPGRAPARAGGQA